MIPIIYCTHPYNSLSPYYLASFISQHFILKPYSNDNDCSGGSIMINLPYDKTIDKIKKESLDKCKFIIVDNLQESYYHGLDKLSPWADKVILLTGGKHTSHKWPKVINIPEWFWYFESLWYKDRGYHQYEPQLLKKQKLFLMPIRRRTSGRELIYYGLKHILDNAIWSYVERGTELPGYPDDKKEDQRWFNPDWYNNTVFSVVNEDSDDQYPLIWTEKTCKPLAFYHPFILVAQQGVLDLIKQSGFQTFPELFDESYDSIPVLKDRVNCVIQQITQFDRRKVLLPELQEKLKYNHDRFFNTTLVYQNLTNQLINPLLEIFND